MQKKPPMTINEQTPWCGSSSKPALKVHREKRNWNSKPRPRKSRAASLPSDAPVDAKRHHYPIFFAPPFCSSLLLHGSKLLIMQRGSIQKRHGAWHLVYRVDEIIDGQPVRKQVTRRLAAVCDDYRSEKDVRPLADEHLGPLNLGALQPEGSMSVSDFAQS